MLPRVWHVGTAEWTLGQTNNFSSSWQMLDHIFFYNLTGIKKDSISTTTNVLYGLRLNKLISNMFLLSYTYELVEQR